MKRNKVKIERRKLFLHLGPSIEVSLRDASDTDSLLVPTTIAHDAICLPRNQGKLELLEKEIVESRAENVIISSEIYLPYLFTHIRNLNYRARGQTDRISQMVRSLSGTHDISVVYYLRPVFDFLKFYFAEKSIFSNLPDRGQTKFEEFCQIQKKQLFHYKNIESWKNTAGISEVVVRPYTEKSFPRSNYLRDVFSATGVSFSGTYNDRYSQIDLGVTLPDIEISDSIATSYEEIYEDSKKVCEEFLEKKEKKIFLQTYSPFYGHDNSGFSLKRLFGL